MSFENSCAPLLTCITFLHAFNASAIPHAQKCLWAISGQATGHEDERKERSVIWCLFPNRSRTYVNTHRPAQTSHKYRLVPVWGGGSSDIGFSQCARTMRVTATRTMNVMVSSVSFHMFQRSPCMVWFVKTKTHHHSSSRCLLYSPGDPKWFLLRFHIQNTVQRFRAHESSRFFLLYLPSSGNTMTEASLWSWIHSAAWCTQPKPALSSEMRRARNRVTNGMTHTEPWSQHPWVSVRLQ